MKNGMKLAAYQFAVSGDIEQNCKIIKNAVREASLKGADLIVFPECALTGYPPRDMASSSDTDFEAVNEALRELQCIADDQVIHIIVGSIAHCGTGCRNRAYLLSPNQPARWYDKRALYGWDEDNFKPGSEKGLFEINGFMIGIRICFEVRFPEYFRELYLENTDLDIVLFCDVADEDDETRYQMIRSHLITRAVENVTPLLSANSIHPHQTAPTCFIDASGAVCAELGKDQEGLLIYAFNKRDLDFGELGRKRYTDILLGRDKE